VEGQVEQVVQAGMACAPACASKTGEALAATRAGQQGQPIVFKTRAATATP
jgi:hypothetical protein